MRVVGQYAGWGDFWVLCDDKAQSFNISHTNKKKAIKNFRLENIIVDGKKIGGAKNFGKCEHITGRIEGGKGSYLYIKYSKGKGDIKWVSLKFIFDYEGMKITTRTSAPCVLELSGDLNWGNAKAGDVYPMSSKKKGSVVRTAVGPASSALDDMIFDRLTDSALKFSGANTIRIKYDYKKKTYVLKAVTGSGSGEKTIKITSHKDIIADQYHINYAPINKNATFGSKPPAGWMSWYSVEFEACEERILKNAKWMSENLKKYGANCIWVDWEWRHRDYIGKYDDGTDNFHPDKTRYPRGLDYVASEIKKMSITPGLWIGFTNDVAENKYIKETPEMLLTVADKWWCGAYIFDYSHPRYLNEFLPDALNTVKKWGYEAIKYDTISDGQMWHEEKHQNMYDPSISVKEAHRRMIAKTREVLGKDYYMLSCGVANNHDMLCAIEFFDAARIGGDIFKWETFLKQGVGKAVKYRPLHNNVVYTDADCVVMREKFSTLNQAASRIYFITMLGLPLNFGDEFTALDEKRIDFIKECMPVLETHPMDIYEKKMPKDVLKMTLAIDKEWESYNVVNTFNMLDEKNSTKVELSADLGLEDKEYLVYDYTGDKFLGTVKDSFDVKLDKCESRIYSVREKLDRPQLISTSRHISQGAAEITDMKWESGENTLNITSDLIDNVPYSITLYVPDGYKASEDLEKLGKNIYRKTVTPKKDGEETIVIKFTK